MKKLAWLAGSTLLFWSVLIYPGWLVWGDVAWIHSLSALALCLLPALGSLVWAQKSGAAPEKQLVAVLGGTGIRLLAALGGGLLLYETLPLTFTNVFWGWVVVFYLFILALETALILKKTSPV